MKHPVYRKSAIWQKTENATQSLVNEERLPAIFEATAWNSELLFQEFITY